MAWIAYDCRINVMKAIMQDLSKYSLNQLRKLEAQLAEELNKRHFLAISQAREQILHIARGAGLSVNQLLSGKSPNGKL